MAKTGSISITYKQDITKNQTTITVKGLIKTSGDSYRGDHRTGTYTIKLGSKTIKSGSFTSGCDKNKTTTLFTVTVTVTHNADGTYGTVTASYNYDPNGWDMDVSSSKDIPTIPRSTTPTFSLNEVELGNPVTINLPRASETFTHTIEYSIGSVSEVIGTDVETSVNWTPQIDLANQIPNSINDDVTIKCTTYSGTTVIGTKNTLLKVKVPENIKPTFTAISHTDASADVLNAFGVYVQSKSKLAVSVVGAEGSYGSTIISYLIELDNQKINDVSGITGFITQSGNLTIKATITDSRGRICTKTTDVYIYEYTTPFFRNVDIIREDHAVVVTATGSCSSIMVDESEKNELKYRILIKEKNSDEWTDTGVVSTGVIGYALQGRIEGLEPNVSYEVKLYAGDKITESGAYDLAVSTAIVYLDKDVKNGRLGLGKMLEYDDSFLEVPQGKKAYFGEYHKQLDNLLEYVEDENIVEWHILKYKDKQIAIPKYEDTGWVDVTLNNGYMPYTDVHPLQIRRIGKVVHMRNVVANTNAVTFDGTQVICNLPEQFRPSKDERVVQQGSGSNRFIILVSTYGNVIIDRYSNDASTRKEASANSWLNMYMTWFVD